MSATVDQIADRIYRISTFVPDLGPDGFTFNQFLVDAEEPLLYHTGMRQLFPDVREAIERVMPVERLRWIAFAHLEADECGAVDEFLEAAPHAQVAHGALGVTLSLQDQLPRPPRPLEDGEVIDLGGAILARRVVEIATPHVPHNWESHMFFEQETGTLFLGDLLTQVGNGPAITSDDLLDAAIAGRGHVPPDLARPGRPRDLPPARRPEPHPARDHARLVVRRRLRGPAARDGRRLRAALRMRHRSTCPPSRCRRTRHRSVPRRDRHGRRRDPSSPRTPALPRDVAMRLAAHEYEHVRRPAAGAVAGGLVAADRCTPGTCTRWPVTSSAWRSSRRRSPSSCGRPAPPARRAGCSSTR